MFKKRLVWIISFAFAAFHIYTSGFGLLPNVPHRAIHVAFACILVLLTKQVTKSRPKSKTHLSIYEILLAVVVVLSVLPPIMNYKEYLTFRAPFPWYEMAGAIAITLIIIEAVRRTTGLVFPIMIGLAFIYVLYGPYFPGRWSHAGQSLTAIFRSLYQTDVGIWGFITDISAGIVAIFVIFGTFIATSGAGESFIKTAYKVAGRLAGGPALVAVIGSGLMGTISGSAIANVSTVGVFTIPAMGRAGYRPEFAAGVEAAASTGGMMMPPVMAAVAFIMAELLGVSYIQIMIYSLIPACLYYISIFSNIYFEAKRLGLQPAPPEEIPKWREILSWARLSPFVFPLIALVYLLMRGWTVYFACFWAIVIASVLFLFSDFKLGAMKGRVIKLLKTIQEGGAQAAPVATLLIAAQILVSLMNISGLGLKLADLIMALGGSSAFWSIITAALLVNILGMGLPAAACYIIGVSIPGVALVKLGYPAYAVHMFVFYYACLSNITPPVCPASYVAAGIAKARWFPTAVIACRLVAPVFVMVFFFLFNPALMMQAPPLSILYYSIMALIGVVAVGSAFGGYLIGLLSIPARVLFVLGGFTLLIGDSYWHMFGGGSLALGLAITLLLALNRRRLARASTVKAA